MLPAWLRNGPQVKLPKTSTTGFGPMSFESVTSSLPSSVFRVKSGADSSSFGPGWSEPSSCRNRLRTSVAFETSARVLRASRRLRLGKRLLQVGERQEALAAAVGRPEERVELLARDLAVGVAVGAENSRAPGEGAGALEEKSKSARSTARRGCGPVGRSPRRRRDLLPLDPSVAVAVEPLAGRGPVEAGLRHGRPEPAIARLDRVFLEDLGQHVDPLGVVGPGIPQRLGHLGRFTLGRLCSRTLRRIRLVGRVSTAPRHRPNRSGISVLEREIITTPPRWAIGNSWARRSTTLPVMRLSAA